MAGYQRAQISCPNCKASIIVRDLGGDLLDARLATREVSGPVLVTDVRPQSAIVPAEPTWFVAVGRDRKGPFTPLQLSELLAVSTISGQSLVWQKGLANWVPMVDVLELRPLLRAPSNAHVASGPRPMMPRPESGSAAPAEPSPPAAPVQAAPAPAAAPAPVVAAAPAPAAPPAHVPAAPPPAPAAAVQPPAKPTDSDLHAVQTDSFFTSHHDLDHAVLAMPEADKDKPTKEEYQNLLQEFSVMFRLDKRSKRQKILITVIVAALVLGAIGFGLVLRYQGMQKARLLADANNILGMFNLPYQTSVTIDVANDTPEPPAKPGEAPKPVKPPEPKQEVQLSDLAAKMRTVVKAKKAATKAPVGPTVSEEEKKRLLALLDSGGPAVRGATVGEALSAGEVRKMCEAQKPTLRACGQSAGVADFKIRFTVGAGGRVEDVKASADGKDNPSLASCCENKLHKVHLGGSSSESFSCTID